MQTHAEHVFVEIAEADGSWSRMADLLEGPLVVGRRHYESSSQCGRVSRKHLNLRLEAGSVSMTVVGSNSSFVMSPHGWHRLPKAVAVSLAFGATVSLESSHHHRLRCVLGCVEPPRAAAKEHPVCVVHTLSSSSDDDDHAAALPLASDSVLDGAQPADVELEQAAAPHVPAHGGPVGAESWAALDGAQPADIELNQAAAPHVSARGAPVGAAAATAASESWIARDSAVPEAKRQRSSVRPVPGAPIFDAADAVDLARRLASNDHHSRHQAGVKLLPSEAPSVQRYESVRRALRDVDPSLLGFRLLEADDALLSGDQASRILQFCRSIDWEPRLGKEGRAIPGTQRKSFGVTTERAGSYTAAVSSAVPLPPPLAALGERLLHRLRALPWPYASTSIEHLTGFEQAYVQVYPPAGGSHSSYDRRSENVDASTLGFHFDDRGCYGELICGVTLCGSAKLLL